MATGLKQAGGRQVNVPKLPNLPRPPNPVTAAQTAANLAARTLRQQTAVNRIAARSALQQQRYISSHPNAPGGRNFPNILGPLPSDTAGSVLGGYTGNNTGATYQGGAVDLSGYSTAPVGLSDTNTAASSQATTASRTNLYLIIGGVVIIGLFLFLRHRRE